MAFLCCLGISFGFIAFAEDLLVDTFWNTDPRGSFLVFFVAEGAFVVAC